MKRSEARVLVVEDEVALRQIFVRWLRSAEWAEVFEAGNGAEALDVIASRRVDVMVTDVRMPVMHGVALVRRLAEQGVRLSCIVLVSAFSDVDPREMYALGVGSLLAKPFQLEELSAALAVSIADRSGSWTTRMDVAPRQTVTFHVSLEAEGEADQWGSFRLGSGGFSTETADSLVFGRISFRCRFIRGMEEVDEKGEPLELVGQGYVRWRSRFDQSVGIEFAYLESPGREWVQERLRLTAPRSFIP